MPHVVRLMQWLLLVLAGHATAGADAGGDAEVERSVVHRGGWLNTRRHGAWSVLQGSEHHQPSATHARGAGMTVVLAQQSGGAGASIGSLARSMGCPLNCSGHGECKEDDACDCEPGYAGAGCDEYDCSGVNMCSDRGNCVGPQECNCTFPWAGSNCTEDSRCEDKCNGHGHCLYGVGTCYCDEGYEGDRCDGQTGAINYRKWTRLYPPINDGSKPIRSNMGAKASARYAHAMTSLAPDKEGMIPGFVVFGGRSQGRTLGDMWSFEIADSSWHHIGQFSAGPGPRAMHSLVSTETSILLYGGLPDDNPNPSPLSELWQYEFEAEAWSLLKPTKFKDVATNGTTSPIIPRAEHTAAIMTHRGITPSRQVMVVYGGFGKPLPASAYGDGYPTTYEYDDNVWVFVLSSMVWYQSAPHPEGGRRAHAVSVSIDGSIMYMFGGVHPSGVLASNALWGYEIDTNTWHTLEPPSLAGPPARSHHVMVAREGKVYIMGGQYEEGRLFNDGWQYDASGGGGGWAELVPDTNAHKPGARSRAGMCVVGAEILVGFGGHEAGGAHVSKSEVWTFTPAEERWRKLFTQGAQPIPRMLHSGVVLDDLLHVFGGETVDGRFLRSLWTFDLGGTDAKSRYTWKEVLPVWVESAREQESDEVGDLVTEAAAAVGGNGGTPVLLSMHGCSCKPTSLDAETGSEHEGCDVDGDDAVPWCDTEEPCVFGEGWDYCTAVAPAPAAAAAGNQTGPANRTAAAGKSKRAVRHHRSLVQAQAGLKQDQATADAAAALQSWPAARSGHAVTVASFRGVAAGACGRGGRKTMVVFGGTGPDDALLNDILVYCPASRQWAELARNGRGADESPHARSSAALAVQDEELFIFGGLMAGRKRANDMWSCRLPTGACQQLDTGGWTPQRRRGMSLSLDAVRSCPRGCTLQAPEHLIMFNGYWSDETGNHNATTQYLQHRCVSLKPPFTDAYCDRTCHVAPDSTGCTARCRCKKDFPMDLWRLKMDTLEWDELHVQSGPSPRYLTQSATYEGRLWMFGGFDSAAGGELNDLWAFDHATSTWKMMDPEPSAPVPLGRHESTFDLHGMRKGMPSLVVHGGINADAGGVLNDVWSCSIADVRYEY